VSGLDALVHRTRPAGGEPEGALVLFHGRGTDENDLFPLLDLLDPERRLTGLTPRGPVSARGVGPKGSPRSGPGGAHWYAVREIGYPDRDTFMATYDLAASWLDSLPAELGIPPERTVIGGFSQGAVMSYALGYGRGRPKPAAIVALSGFMPAVEGFELDVEGRSDIPVAVAHGTYDPIIGVEWGRRANERLSAAGVAVIYQEAPLPHAVDPEFLASLAPWVREAVAAAPAERL
jgi:phospholipase/carboxylesterase